MRGDEGGGVIIEIRRKRDYLRSLFPTYLMILFFKVFVLGCGGLSLSEEVEAGSPGTLRLFQSSVDIRNILQNKIICILQCVRMIGKTIVETSFIRAYMIASIRDRIIIPNRIKAL